MSRQVAKDYPDIEHDDMIIDNCCMQLVSKPHQFDVMLMTNLYGTIVSNVICGLIGGAGLFSGRNYGDEVSLPSSHFACYNCSLSYGYLTGCFYAQKYTHADMLTGSYVFP